MGNKEECFRCIIAGGRTFENYKLLKFKMDKILKDVKEEILIVCGEARGADILGEKYAKERGYKIKYFPADWDKWGKSAGFKRNEEMAAYANAAVIFWDGFSKGSGHMVDLSKKYNLKLRIIKY